MKPWLRKMAVIDLEEARKELNQLCRELVLLEGEIDKVETKIKQIRVRRDALYLDIDKKLDE